MTMKPLADRVLIKVEKEEEKTVGGLVLATKNPAGVPAKGKVVACGEGKFSPNGTRVPMEVKVGDTVLISHSAGQTVKLDGEPAGEMLGEIHVKTQDDKFERDLQFYAIDEFTCLITADGKSAYTCRKTYLDTLLNNMNIYDDTSQDFTTNWS